MHTQAPSAGVAGLDKIKHWKPEHQAKALDLLRERERTEWHPFYCPNSGCSGYPHVLANDLHRECPSEVGHRWVKSRSEKWVCKDCRVGGKPIDDWLFNHGRADQRPPRWKSNWRTWAMKGGRGSGKTETGSRLTHRVTEVTPRIILVGATGPDFRDTMVEGESGILATAPPGKRPTWEPSLKKLTWPNGCIAKGYSAEEPDRLRGPQSGFIWMDEPAHYPLIEEVWSNALLGLRVKGQPAHVLATSTPLPTKWMKKLLAADKTITTTVSTYANMDNLNESFRATVIDEFEGTTRGKQELYGELLEDVEGSLWKMHMIHRIAEVPTGDVVEADDDGPGYVREPVSLTRIVVSIDPAGTANAKSDETGIIVVGLGDDLRIYVLEDLTGKYSPAGWAELAVKAYVKWSADAIVAEKNFGQDMVTHTLESVKVPGDIPPPIIGVQSRRGKALRAEPIVGLYEKGKVLHVVGRMPDGRLGTGLTDLEDEQTTWIPGRGASPNRVDALVHGVTELGKGITPASMALPGDVLKGLSAPTGMPGQRHLHSIPGLAS